jgi:cytochrome oxidase assembly protein ShyY1
MAAGYPFRPRRWPLALGALACAAGIALGQWQSGRAAQKKALAAELERAMQSAPMEVSPAAGAPALVHRHVGARGTFAPKYTVFLDNKLRAGRPGYEVVTPLRLAGSEVHVLVNRGWVQAPPRRDVLPEVPTPSGELRLEGLALERLPRAYQLGKEGGGRVRQNLAVEDFVAETGLAVKSFVLEQHSDTHDGLVREWPRRDLGVEKNESYALQWYSLAALAAVLGAVFAWRKR